MARRYYSSIAQQTTLNGSINNSTTTVVVTATTGFPGSFPYTLIIDPDTVNEEVITVTSAASTTLTVTRGVDGTTAVSHSSGATVRHGVSARDFDEPNAFLNSGGTVGGNVTVSGSVSASALAGSLLSSATPAAASGAGSAGTATTPSREDHVHPASATATIEPFFLTF